MKPAIVYTDGVLSHHGSADFFIHYLLRNKFMSLNYRLIRRTLNFDKKNPQEIVVAQPDQRSTTSLEDIMTLIGQISSVSRGDVLSVISTLTRLVADELAKGNIVDLGELGRLRLAIRSKAAKSIEEFSRNNVLTPAIRFSPGMILRAARRRVQFNIVDETKKGKKEDTTNSSETPIQPNGGGSTPTPSGSENDNE